MESKEVVLITGATSGIGMEAARLLAQVGYIVYGAGRRVEALESLQTAGVRPLRLDVTLQSSIEEAVASIIDAEGRIDVLVNNAGYGSLGPAENFSDQEARRQMDVNVFGLMALTRQVLPYMREKHHGRIVNVSSIAGRVTSLMGGWYHASKYSLEALSDALRREVRPFGIRVVLVEPGAVKTPWADIAADHLDASSQGTAYEQTASRASRWMRRLYKSRWVTEPYRVARVIERAVEARSPKARYRVGFSSTSQLVLKSFLPTKAFDRLITAVTQ